MKINKTTTNKTSAKINADAVKAIQTQNKYPNEIKIFDTVYKVEYIENSMTDVDAFKREALWGQIDYQSSTIRIYLGNRTHDEIMNTIFHEAMHGILYKLGLKYDDETVISLTTLGISTLLKDNCEIKFIR